MIDNAAGTPFQGYFFHRFKIFKKGLKIYCPPLFHMPLSSTQKGHSFSVPKICQFNTKNPSSIHSSVQYTLQLNTKNSSGPWTAGFLMLNSRFFVVELSRVLKSVVGWTEGFLVLNFGAEKVWLLCWTEGSVWKWGALEDIIQILFKLAHPFIPSFIATMRLDWTSSKIDAVSSTSIEIKSIDKVLRISSLASPL